MACKAVRRALCGVALYISTKEVISMLLSGKTVVLGVSGSIAAYKIDPNFSKTA